MNIENSTLQKIIEAAISEFAAKGPFKTTVDSIAKAAGVSHATVYTYFKSKEELYYAVLEMPTGVPK